MSLEQTLDEQIEEQLRQEQETFNQHKAHENRWFILRLVMGYSSVFLLALILLISSYILWNHPSFPPAAVTSAGAALFGDVVGLVIAVWRVVFNPDFMTKLAPVTTVQLRDMRMPSNDSKVSHPKNDVAQKELVILSGIWGPERETHKIENVTRLLNSRISAGKLEIRATPEELGEPCRGTRKELRIIYSYAGQTYTKIIPEHKSKDDSIQLP